jgi:hypothetical protein
MNVFTTPEVKRYLNDLITILYEKEYFGFEETAHRYVDDLLDDITATLHTRPHKPAPPHFNRYGKGMWYAAFRRNRGTTWYAFFSMYNDGGRTVYLVRHIANNHTAARYL